MSNVKPTFISEDKTDDFIVKGILDKSSATDGRITYSEDGSDRRCLDVHVCNPGEFPGGYLDQGFANIFRFNEASVTTRNEFDLANTTYTVPANKVFYITAFTASYDAQAALFVRLKKQTGGAGAWVTQFRLNMMSGGQGNSTISLDLSSGILIGSGGDVFKITIESSIAKGTIFAQFAGIERA